MNKAGLLARLKQYQAFKCFDRGLGINPADSLGVGRKGDVLSELERWNEALLCYDKALALNPYLEIAWHDKGLCLGHLQRPNDALECFSKVLSMNPGHRGAWYNNGSAMTQSSDNYGDALPCFEQAFRLGVQEAATFISLCREKLQLGN